MTTHKYSILSQHIHLENPDHYTLLCFSYLLLLHCDMQELKATIANTYGLTTDI